MKNVLYIVLSFLLLTGCLGLLDKIFGTRKSVLGPSKDIVLSTMETPRRLNMVVMKSEDGRSLMETEFTKSCFLVKKWTIISTNGLI